MTSKDINNLKYKYPCNYLCNELVLLWKESHSKSKFGIVIEMEEIRYRVIGIATRLRKVLELLREIETLLVTMPREDFKDRGMLGFFSEFIRKVAKEYETTERASK